MHVTGVKKDIFLGKVMGVPDVWLARMPEQALPW